jgi:hypothetical protein
MQKASMTDPFPTGINAPRKNSNTVRAHIFCQKIFFRKFFGNRQSLKMFGSILNRTAPGSTVTHNIPFLAFTISLLP